VPARRRLRAGGAVAGEPGDRPAGRDLADLVVARVRDVHVPGLIDGDPVRKAELSVARWSSVPACRWIQAWRAAARDRRDRPGDREPADLVVAPVRDVDLAGGADRDALGEAHQRARGRATVATARRGTARN